MAEENFPVYLLWKASLMKVTEPEDGFPWVCLPAMPSVDCRGEQAWPQGSTGGQQMGCGHTWDTHLTPVLGHDGTCIAVLWLPKDSQVRERLGWNLRSSHTDSHENAAMLPYACPSFLFTNIHQYLPPAVTAPRTTELVSA